LIAEKRGSMADFASLKNRLDELAARVWDEEVIKNRIIKLAKNGISEKDLDPEELNLNKKKILDRVQKHAEEYNYLLKNCAQGTALALLEEFGVGNMDVIKALSAFPGIGGTGETCGGITGGLVAFGLIFGSDDRLDYKAMNATISISQKFIARFEQETGYVRCSDIIENLIVGMRLNPGESENSMAVFSGKKGFEKCCLLPGIGARLAATFIIGGKIQGIP
jgi:C_GCAxxG_C_C family probable redox protein